MWNTQCEQICSSSFDAEGNVACVSVCGKYCAAGFYSGKVLILEYISTEKKLQVVYVCSPLQYNRGLFVWYFLIHSLLYSTGRKYVVFRSCRNGVRVQEKKIRLDTGCYLCCSSGKHSKNLFWWNKDNNMRYRWFSQVIFLKLSETQIVHIGKFK